MNRRAGDERDVLCETHRRVLNRIARNGGGRADVRVPLVALLNTECRFEMPFAVDSMRKGSKLKKESPFDPSDPHQLRSALYTVLQGGVTHHHAEFEPVSATATRIGEAVHRRCAWDTVLGGIPDLDVAFVRRCGNRAVEGKYLCSVHHRMRRGGYSKPYDLPYGPRTGTGGGGSSKTHSVYEMLDMLNEGCEVLREGLNARRAFCEELGKAT
jgi:hypothetical protein